MIKTGKSLEQLIMSLEKVLARNDSIQIESPKRLRDVTTGTLREHDVVLTTNQGHHTVKIAIECRDRSRPVTVNQVEGFWAKCQDTGVNQGIIVSATGFYGTAKKKAEHRGIRCLSIADVDSFNWLLTPGIQSFTKKILHADWVFYPKIDGIIDGTNFEVLDNQNNILTGDVLLANASRELNELLPQRLTPTAEAVLHVRFEGDGLIMRDLKSGQAVEVAFAMVTIRYSIRAEFIPFRMVQYVDKDKNKTITDAAVAEVDFGNHRGKLMIVYKEDKGGQVVFVPEKKNE
jgi:hypothetical protein